MEEEVRAAGGELEPEEERESDDADQTSDSSSLKERGGRVRDRKRSNTFLTPVDRVDASEAEGGDSVVSASAYWRHGSPLEGADAKLGAIRRYFRAARALYELQYQMKRPSAILRMKSNSYGFKTNSTFDTLAALISPLRQHQVLDDWTALEIAIFEASFEKFGRKFHLIADQLPNKSAKDVISFFYIWKKHGSCAKYDDFEDDFAEPNLSVETKHFVEKLRRRQSCMKAYLSAARSLYAPRAAPRFNHKRAKIAEFGLRGVSTLQSAVNETSVLKATSALGELQIHGRRWRSEYLRSLLSATAKTSIAFLVCECSMVRYDQIGTKTCREVIALYYIWKKDSHYQTVKNRWGKNEVYAKKTPERANSTKAGSSD